MTPSDAIIGMETLSSLELVHFDPMSDDWHSPDNKINQKSIDLTLPADRSVSILDYLNSLQFHFLLTALFI